jgi:hypothetical protein
VRWCRRSKREWVEGEREWKFGGYWEIEGE